jgi:hypothetical protein
MRMAELPTSFVTTRAAVHSLAEHVLCAARYSAVGRVGLTPAPDGIETPHFDGRTVGLHGVELVDTSPAGERRSHVTTLREAAEFFAVTPGAPALWTPTTPLDLDVPLHIEAHDVTTLAAWFGLVAQALHELAPDAPQTLWPEHFDLAISLDDATYGGSPGDDEHTDPYIYVVPPAHPVPDGDRSFWNEPFGAGLPFDRVESVEVAVEFLADGRRRLESIRSGGR